MQKVYLVQYQLIGDNDFRGVVRNSNILFKDKEEAEKYAYKFTIDNAILSEEKDLIEINNDILYSIRAWVEELVLID